MSSEIETADICERLVGITPISLNNFLQRGLFGLKSSIQAGKLRERKRLFSQEDVFGIALVWVLFESGLRTDPIVRILKDIAGKSKVDANGVAKKILNEESQWIEISRQPRPPSKNPSDRPEQTTRVWNKREVRSFELSEQAASTLFIPVGAKFSDIQHRLELLFNS